MSNLKLYVAITHMTGISTVHTVQHMYTLHMIQLISKLTLECANYACILQFLQVTQLKLVCDMLCAAHEPFLCTAHEPYFVWHCTIVRSPRVRLGMLHMSKTSCAACKSVFLCATHNVTTIVCQIAKNQGIQ